MKCPWCSNPEGMKMSGKSYTSTVGEIVEEIKSCIPMFFDGGGVTFTGGECMLQYNALLKVIEELKKQNISVAIESNASTKNFFNVAQVCDYVILDYKHPDLEKLQDITGGNLYLIQENIRKIIIDKKIHIRIPLIHGFNDDDEALEGFKKFFASLCRDKFDVEILEYHEYGKNKWNKLGLEYKVADGYVSSERVKKIKAELKNVGVTIINT